MGEMETQESKPNDSNGHATVRPASDVFVAMPVLPQAGEVFIGPGSKKDAQLLGLGLTKLSSRRKEDLAAAKRYAMDVSIKQIMIRQQKAQQENQQKQIMYAQALSLMGRVYIGSVSFEVREENIKKAFEVFGPIKSINMSYDATTGHHKGFAFLEYEIPEAALLAQESMNGQLMGGRNLKVSQVGRPANMPQAQPIIEMLQNDAKKYYRVYVSDVHQDLSESDLKTVFEAFGEIVRCQLARQNSYGKGIHRGFGYIEFTTRNAMQEAIAGMNMFDLGGQFLRVGRCITPPEALQYLQPTSATAIPAAAAVAAAAITAKVMAVQATGGAKNTISSKISSPAPAIMPKRNLPTTKAKVNSPAPKMAITDGSQTPPGYVVPPPVQVQVPPPRLSLTSSEAAVATTPSAPSAPPTEASSTSSTRRGFGGFAADAPPPPSTLPHPAVAVPEPGIVDPLAGTSAAEAEKDKDKKKKKKKRVDDRSLDEKFQKLFNQKKNLWEESLMGPASFGVVDAFVQPKEDEEKKEEKLAQLAITGNVQSMALAIIGDGQLVAVGKAKTQDPDKPAAPKQQRRSNRVKDPKKIQPKLKTASQVAAAHSAGALGDAIRQEATSQEDASLASQESVQSIRGNDARHLLMAKLMRTNRSSVLVLRNMVGVEDIDEHLEEEIREECGKYGRIVDLLIANDEFKEAVKIFVRYTEPAEVDAAIAVLNGRFFGGRTVKAEVYDQAMYDHGDLTG